MKNTESTPEHGEALKIFLHLKSTKTKAKTMQAWMVLNCQRYVKLKDQENYVWIIAWTKHWILRGSVGKVASSNA
ncbi:hypothetical protein KP509_13G074500 [Ceratopteris richardii]|nr:hypothetical protein KP509_13G074500 [Ceratopteris richardii]